MVKKLWLPLLIILALGGGWWWKSKDIAREIVHPKVAEEVTGIVSLEIDFGDGKVATYSGLPATGETAYEILSEVAKKEGMTIDAKQYDFGIFIQGIGGKENTNDKSWIYFVNGEAGNVAADQRILEAGDRVEWKYIKPQGE